MAFTCSTVPSGSTTNPITLISCSPMRYDGACNTSLDKLFVSHDGVNFVDSGETCHDAGTGANVLTVPDGAYDDSANPLYVKASYWPDFISYSSPVSMGGTYSFVVGGSTPSRNYSTSTSAAILDTSEILLGYMWSNLDIIMIALSAIGITLWAIDWIKDEFDIK